MINLLPCLIRAAMLPLLLSLAACGNLDSGKFVALRDAARQIDGSAASSFAALEQSARDSAVLSAPDRKVGLEGFPLVNAEGQPYDLSGQLGKVEASLDLLASYAAALAQLAGAGGAADIDKSSQDLSASLRRLQGSGLSVSTANGLASAVDAFGHARLTAQRKSSLRAVMDQAQPGLEVLALEMQRVQQDLQLYLTDISLRYLRAVDKDGFRPAYGSWARYQGDLQVAAQLADFDRQRRALDAIGKEMRAFPDLHRQLRQSLDDSGKRIDRLREFVDEAKRLRSLYRALPSQ
ncbi:hypothetical protein BI347_14760 [Chromobacterium sphagni]|uniref:DUF3829 domain-containing protein n=1 Tax=Chromobacterium sphagni TaxID=1903179 RepID=A0A1S1X596_9NEIS|nr:hypothetical protein [Chromobacterium sphagni]OHX14627.1 hypothetical protein BI347_14760 [Chromobacterium sphagni]